MRINSGAYRLLSLCRPQTHPFSGTRSTGSMFGTIGSLHRSRFRFSSEWLKEHSQLTGFNLSVPKMAAKPKRVRNKANFVQQSNRITVI